MTPEQRIDALAFNAVSQALGDADEWLRLTVRQEVARAVLAAVLSEYEKQVREQVAAEARDAAAEMTLPAEHAILRWFATRTEMGRP